MARDILSDFTGDGIITVPQFDTQQFRSVVEQNEGRRSRVYNDSLGIPTVGVGFNLDRDDARPRIEGMGVDYDDLRAGNTELTDAQIDSLVQDDLETAVNEARSTFSNWDTIDPPRQVVLADMAYNMGGGGLRTFKKMIAAVEAGDWGEAAAEAQDSLWFNQVGDRGPNNVSVLRTGDLSGYGNVQVAGDPVFNDGPRGGLDAWLSGPDASTSIRGALEKNPDAEAKNLQLSRESGLPIDAVASQPEEVEKVVRQGFIQDLLGDAPASATFLENPANAALAHDSVENLTAPERLSNAFERGQLIRERGVLGTKLRDGRTPTTQLKIDEVEARLSELGQDGDGVIGWLSAAAEILGQQVSSLSDPDAALRVGGGGATGAAVGAAGGPLAPATSSAGALIGMGAGLLSHMAIDTFEVEGGNAYIDMVQSGIDPDAARWTSLGVGLINSALEVGGAAVVLKPFADAGKSVFRASFKNAMKAPAVVDAAKKLALAYSAGVTVETTTEIMQEGVNILAEEIGKAFTEDELASITPEEIEERLGEIAVKTFKGMTVFALPGPSVNFAIDVSAMRQAKKNQIVLDEMNKEVQNSPLAERDAVKSAEHMAEVLKSAEVHTVSIPADQLLAWVENQQQLEAMGISEETSEAIMLGGDVTLSAEVFAEHVMHSERYNEISEHVRMQEDGMTAAEAQEFETSGVQEAVEAAGTEAEIIAPVAEQETGIFTPQEDTAADPEEVSRDTLDVAAPEPAAAFADSDQEISGVGLETRDFFSGVTRGEVGQGTTGKAYEPVLNLAPIQEFADTRAKHTGNFDIHIETSIPGYGEVQPMVGDAITKAFPEGEARFLDIGGSEGALSKAITETTDGRITSTVVDPNPDMQESFNTISEVPGTEYSLTAFGTDETQDGEVAFEEDGQEVRFFEPDGKYDVVHESMVFQFISNERKEQVRRVAELTEDDGLAIFQEKFLANEAQIDAWNANEAQKDEFKTQFFSEEDISKKREQVLVGMNRFMVTPQSFEDTLKKNFKFVAQYWDSGNFKGYVATNDRARMQAFLDNMADTSSDFATVETPRAVQDPATADAFSPENIQDLLERDDFALLSAERAGLSPEENAERMEQLKAKLAEEGIEFLDLQGQFEGVPEQSLAVLTDQETAQAIAEEFEQDAILTRQGLIMRDGTIVPASGIRTFAQTPDADFTSVPETGAIFTVDLENSQQSGKGNIEDPPPPKDPVTLAENLMGLRGLFRTAAEAGMTEKQYASYLVAIQRMVDGTQKRQEKRRLKRQERENSKEFDEVRKAFEDEATANVELQPVYQAFDGIGRERLNQEATAELLSFADLELSDLPKQPGGRTIYAPKNEAGIHPDQHAQVYDFIEGQDMLTQMANAPTKEMAIEQELDRMVRQRRPDLFEEADSIQAALRDLHNDQTEAVLALEMNQLREAQGQGRMKPALLREAARQRIREYPIQALRPDKFLSQERKWGRAAAKALRKGDRAAAADAKFKQLLNFEYAMEAYRLREKMAKQRKFIRRFTKRSKKVGSLPPDYLAAIRTVLNGFGFGLQNRTLTRGQLETWAAAKTNDEGVAVEIPQRLLDNANTYGSYREMPLGEWELLHDTIKTLHHQGVHENKMLRQQETADRNEVAAAVANQISTNLKPRGRVVETRARMEKFKRFAREAVTTLFNADTITREMDGFEDLGVSYRNLKGRYDQAMTEGYHEGQVGYTNRQLSEAQSIIELYDVYTKREKLNMTKPREIPGVGVKLSRQGMLSVLLNLGNAENQKALLEGEQFTEAELDAIIDTATETDWKFVQSVWDYLDSFWPEVSAATQRRNGYVPERVEASPVQTKFGTMRGGYYPLRYDNKQSILESESSTSTENAVEDARFGRFVSSHTRRHHTEQRVGSGGRKILLDLFVLNSHVDQVIYDLEVGDAITDVFRTLHHKTVKKGFENAGHLEKWEALDLWLGDVVTGELRQGGFLEHSLRWLRTGFTISKLGWNVGTMLLQPLGLIQTSVLIGKRPVYDGLRTALAMPQFGENSVYNFVAQQTGQMAQREDNFNKDIIDASRQLSDSVVARFTPGKSAEMVTASFFYGIKKFQRFVDVVTWLGAKQKGMEQFQGDETRANEFADRMVVRSQASGIFGERTPLERGTATNKLRQSEMVRVWTPLISYFMAKTNVAYERTKKTNFRNPGQVIGWATDMVLLYLVEALLVSVIRGQFPDPEEDDPEDIALFVGGEAVNSLAAGVPILREFISEAQGFRGGGVMGNAIDAFGRLSEQVGQGEVDEALVKSANNFMGMMLHYPSSQLNKTGAAVYDYLEGEDLEAIEFLMGPRWEE